MKTIRLLLVFLIILTLLAACGGDTGQPPLATAGPNAEAAPAEEDSSSRLCGALPASMLLLGGVGLAAVRRTKE